MPHCSCAVIGCNSSTYQLELWKTTWCEEHQINFGIGRCICDPPFVLKPFPTARKDPSLRQRWINAISRKVKVKKRWVDWAPNADSRVCSKHFAPDENVPSLNLGRGNPKDSDEPPRKKRRVLQRPVLTPSQSLNQPEESDYTDIEDDPENEPVNETTIVISGMDETPPTATAARSEDVKHDHSYLYQCDCSAHCSCPGCRSKADLIQKLCEDMGRLSVEVDGLKRQRKVKCSLKKSLLKTDKKVTFYTGLPNVATFDSLLEYLEPRARKLRYWYGQKKTRIRTIRKYKATPKKHGPERLLLLEDEMLLTLMKLRLDLNMEDLADRFSISVSTASSIFSTWIKFLSCELKSLIFFPERDVVLSTMPTSFLEQGSRARVIIDCTEVFIERPRDLCTQALTWSDYKKNNTAKFLVAVTPQGHIAYVSKCWGGRTSDRHIVAQSGFLNHLDPGDEIMADRGFPIREELLLRRAKLIIPPSAKGQEQMRASDVTETKMVANLRIHVERAINRIKWFSILKGILPITQVQLLDDIVVVCSALCNIAPPLVE